MAKRVHLSDEQTTVLRPYLDIVTKATRQISQHILFAYGPSASLDLETLEVVLPDDGSTEEEKEPTE
jgi:hypothetical protein